jgi:hypothetical protein
VIQHSSKTGRSGKDQTKGHGQKLLGGVRMAAGCPPGPHRKSAQASRLSAASPCCGSRSDANKCSFFKGSAVQERPG